MMGPALTAGPILFILLSGLINRERASFARAVPSKVVTRGVRHMSTFEARMQELGVRTVDAKSVPAAFSMTNRAGVTVDESPSKMPKVSSS